MSFNQSFDSARINKRQVFSPQNRPLVELDYEKLNAVPSRKVRLPGIMSPSPNGRKKIIPDLDIKFIPIDMRVCNYNNETDMEELRDTMRMNTLKPH